MLALENVDEDFVFGGEDSVIVPWLIYDTSIVGPYSNFGRYPNDDEDWLNDEEIESGCGGIRTYPWLDC